MLGLLFQAASVVMSYFDETLTTPFYGAAERRELAKAQYKSQIVEVEAQAMGSAMDSTRLAYGLICYLSHIAKADGHYDESERELINKIVKKVVPDIDLNPDPNSKNEAHKRLHELLAKAPLDETTPKVLFSQAREDTNLRKALLTFGWRVAAADGRISRKEIERMTKLGFEMRANMIEIEWSALPFYRLEGFESDKREICEMLNLPNNASFDEIESVYPEVIKKIEIESQEDISEERRTELSEDYARLNEAFQQVSNNWQETEWFAHDIGYNRVAPVEKMDKIRCIVCDRVSEKPIAERYSVARCPECQALLCYPQDKAILLSKQD